MIPGSSDELIIFKTEKTCWYNFILPFHSMPWNKAVYKEGLKIIFCSCRFLKKSGVEVK